MSERPTPETDAVVFDDPLFANGAVCADFARRLERERDEAAADAARAEAANTIAAAQLAVIEAEGPKQNEAAVATVRGAALFLAVSPRTVRNYIKAGTLRAVKIGGAVRIPRHQLETLVGQ